MASIFWSSVSLLILLAFPFNADADQPAARPGRAALLPGHGERPALLRLQAAGRAADLRLQPDPARRSTWPGPCPSIVQGITASKAPFARTPKVTRPHGRAAVPAARAVRADRAGGLHLLPRLRPPPARRTSVYAALNVILACYAVVAFIGLRNSLVDAWIHVTSLLFSPAERAPAGLPAAAGGRRRPPSAAAADWRSRAAGGLRRAGQYPHGRAAAARCRGPPPAPAPRPAARRSPRRRTAAPQRRLSLARGARRARRHRGRRLRRLRASAKTRLLRRVRADRSQTWFAPYVDVTLTPTYQFQNPSHDPARQSVLGFVVARRRAGAAARRAGAAPTRWPRPTSSSPLGTRIAQLQQEGAAGHRVVRRPGQHQPGRRLPHRRRAHRGLPVGDQRLPPDHDRPGHRGRARWTTSPPSSGGPRRSPPWSKARPRAQRVADPARRAVRAAGQRAVRDQRRCCTSTCPSPAINIMTMDFSAAPAAGRHAWRSSAEAALTPRHRQLADAATPSTASQLRTAADLAAARRDRDDRPERHPAARTSRWPTPRAWPASPPGTTWAGVSMWSINRDSQCGSSFSETGLLSNTCSGTPQSGLQFAQIFGQLQGRRG